MAALRYPPPSRPIDRKKIAILTLSAGRRLLRIYDPASRFPTGPRTFRKNGPRLRFDHHRGLRVARRLEPDDDPDRGIYYAAFDFDCAVIEVFGDARIIERGTFVLVTSFLRDDLHLLDLRGDAAIRAGTIHAIGQIESRPKTWAWSRYFYEHRTAFGEIDGIVYRAAHNGKDAVALYERAQRCIERAAQHIQPLSDPRLEIRLLEIADATGFPLV